jgi:Pentapeptide repeats (8 copies)
MRISKSAWFQHADLEGAYLESANLQGATFVGSTRLHGASLDGARGAAYFKDVFVWRAEAPVAGENTLVASSKTSPKTDCDNEPGECDWTAASFARLKQLVVENVPEGFYRRTATERIEERLDPTKALKGEKEMAKGWAARERVRQKHTRKLSPSSGASWAAPRRERPMYSMDCNDAYDSPLDDQSEAAKTLAKAFLDEHCAGAHGLSQCGPQKDRRASRTPSADAMTKLDVRRNQIALLLSRERIPNLIDCDSHRQCSGLSRASKHGSCMLG